VLSTYPLLARAKEVLLRQAFHYVILDEAQNIKNAKTQAAAIARQLNARHRLCLSGTPLENHLGELWSLFHFLLPGFLGREEQFRELYRTPIEKQGDTARQRALAKRVAPFLLRRTKDQVAKELPAKTEISRSVELNGAQRDLYETLRVAMHERVQQEIANKGLARSHIVILDALLKLRQVCCDPRLVKLERAKVIKESAKLELLMALLPQLVEEGRKVLVFSQFTSMLALIEDELTNAGVGYCLLTGATRNRAAQIEAFQSGQRSVFLLSLKAGGTGLNLTAADTVIHYDPWWNPQVERQATDRAHRIGQDKPVFVYKLIAAGSVEEKIVALQEKKAALVRGVLEQDSAAMTTLSGEDLRALFEPLR
jgi:SNF2 family DNA or RNA helicase